MTPNFTPLTGPGRFPRAIRELQEASYRAAISQVPGALVSITPRGVLIQPNPVQRTVTSPIDVTDKTPRWG